MCLSPVTITRKNPALNRYYMNNVPCGHCLECIKDKQNEYVVRTIEEWRKRGNMVFFTLTYSPDALPMKEYEIADEQTGEMSFNETQTLRRADVTLWLHTFRKRCKRRKIKVDFGHLICGEYGPKTQRPHYHGIILGLDRDLVNELMYDWKQKYGYVCFNYIPALMADVEKVARYTAKYITKNEDWNIVPDYAEKPRKMTSQFYGMPTDEKFKAWQRYYTAQDIAEYDINHPKFDGETSKKVYREIIKRRKYRLGNGKEFKLPDYYKRKIFYTKVDGKVRASEIQRLVTFYVQRDFDKNFKEELHNLATLYNLGEYVETLDRYNSIHDDDKRFRAIRYEESDNKYMAKSIY